MSFLHFLFGARRSRSRRESTEPSRPEDILGRQVLSLTLAQVRDIFDADALWSARHTKSSAVRDKASRRSGYRLYEHLKANKRRINHQDPGSGRLLGLRRVYTDVVVQIHPALWTREIRSGEPGFAILTHNLALRHREDFKRDLKALRRAPRYVVAPAADVALDEVRFLFGSSIFVPDEHDELQAHLWLLGPAGERLPVLDWEVYDHTGGMLRRPAGLYAEQRSCLIRGPGGPALIPQIASAWPSGNRGFVQLSRPPSAEHWRVYDDMESSRCKDANGEPYSDGRRYRFVGPSGREVLSLLLQPVAAEAQGQAADPPDPPDSEQDGLLPTHPAANARPSFVLRLAAIALPRIDGPRQIRLRNGIALDGWRLWLDPNGGLADLDQSDPSTLAMLTAEAATGRLLARHAGTSEPVAIERRPYQLRTNPSDPADELTVSAPFHENHLGMVWLSTQPELALAYVDCPVPGPRWMGRAGGRPGPELCLDFLDQPGSLLWSRPGVATGSLGQFELSRQQLQAELDPMDGRLVLTPPQNGSPVPSFALDATLRPLAILRPGNAALQLELGQYLMLGCYLLRFERFESASASSGDVTLLPGLLGPDRERTVVAQRPAHGR